MLNKAKWRLGSALSPQEALETANDYLEIVRRTKNSKLALTNCDNAEGTLYRIKISERKTLMSSSRVEDRTMCNEIAAKYFEIGQLWHRLGRSDKARTSYKNEEKWGGHVQLPGQTSSASSAVDPAAVLTADQAVDPAANPSIVPPLSIPPSLSPPHLLVIQERLIRDTARIPPHIFVKNMDQPLGINKMPGVGDRLESIPQLVHCLELLRSSQPIDGTFDQDERDWLKDMEHDTEEQDRLKMLATNLLREFIREELKDSRTVAEIVCLVPVLEKSDLQELLQRLFHGIEKSKMLKFDLIEGLAQLVQWASPGHLNADNLVKILQLISARLQDTHKQSPENIYQLSLTVSRVLDAMADSNVKDLDRGTLHAPLSAYLKKLQDGTDPYLVYQAAYASQALLYVPDNETLWQATQRRTGKLVKGVAGLVSAVKGLDLNNFVEGLKHIQEGLAGVSDVFKLATTACKDVSTLAKSGEQFVDCLKEGLSFSHKRAWYPALRGADVMLQNGLLIDFKTLICEAPCRRDPEFQWGICQRLGEIAANTECDDDARNSAVEFLREMYENDTVWGEQANIKQWILDILMKLAAASGSGISMQAAKTLLVELELNGSDNIQALYRCCREKGPGPHPLKVILPPPTSQSLLDRVQKKVDVEGSLSKLKNKRHKQRLIGGGNDVYISPQARANLKSRDDELFPLMEKVEEFLDSEGKVFLLLGDSGAGKSTFNQELEYSLWNSYKIKEGRIPLFIALAMIQNPERDLIAKHLRSEKFTEDQIQELKDYREFILICDGYDESRQTYNLYQGNRLNDPGEWQAQMVVSCRGEYLGPDYLDRFQPVDRNRHRVSPLFQESVIAPFSVDQIKDYVKKFVSLKDQQWKDTDYLRALDQIHGLKDLVTNPFLLVLSLDVLPSMVNPGQSLTAIRITRVELYDQFVEQWLERGKVRLVEIARDQDQKSFARLTDGGFVRHGIAFLKDLSTAIYEKHSGISVVEYSSFRDKGTWKEAFFDLESEKRLLREACPLSCNGDQYRFLHQSLLEYSLARAVFEPKERGNVVPMTVEPTTTISRLGSVSSGCSTDSRGSIREDTVAVEQPIMESPLGRKSFVDEPSILQFLVERVRQEPLFKKQLLAVIELSKTEKVDIMTVRIAAANAITILVRVGMQFNGADLQGIQIPGADLSYGVFEDTKLQGGYLENVTLRSASLHGADLSGAQMAGAQFGELPFLQEESGVSWGAYSPDGKTFTVSLENGNISIYTTSNWERTEILRSNISFLSMFVFSPDGNQIASACFDNKVRLWDVEARECRHTLEGHTNRVSSVAYSPEGDQIAFGSDDETVRLWDVETGECRHTLEGHTDCVMSIAYSPKGDQITSGGPDGTVRLWDVETGECRHTLESHTDCVMSIAYSPKGGQIASCGLDNTVRLWDVETGQCRHTLEGHTNYVTSIAYSPKGDQIASSSHDETVRCGTLKPENAVAAWSAITPSYQESHIRQKAIRLRLSVVTIWFGFGALKPIITTAP